MIFKDLTLKQLRASTKEQIITGIMGILTPMSKKLICEFIWGIRDIITDNLTLGDLVKKENGPNGRLLRVYQTTDVLGNKLSSQKIEWTYYPTGEVDTIVISDLDALDTVISTKTIKHFIDGRQPIVL